jgi:hypothetical protein
VQTKGPWNNGKPKLLIAWGGGYLFDEVISPLIPLIARDFSVVIMMGDFCSPPRVYEQLSVWQDEGVIVRAYTVPSPEKGYSHYAYMRSHKKELQDCGFDMCLLSMETTIFERYLFECVLPSSCKKVCISTMVTYLFEREAMVRGLLGESDGDKSGQQAGGDGKRFIAKLFSKSPWQLCQALIRRLITKKQMASKKVYYIYSRFLLPWLLERRTFPMSETDHLTQLSSGRSDAIIFVDALEVEVHKKLYPNTLVLEARYPTSGSCRCSGVDTSKDIVLSPLSGFVGHDKIAEEYLALYYRDLKTVQEHSGARAFHLRLHPRETGDWPNQLQRYLAERGIVAEIVPCDKPLRAVTCDYMGVAGFTSNSLRDAEACCNHAFVVGFVGVSKSRYHNPKFVYGEAVGIRWIEEDGNFEPDIFTARERSSSKNDAMDVPSLLNGLAVGSI